MSERTLEVKISCGETTCDSCGKQIPHSDPHGSGEYKTCAIFGGMLQPGNYTTQVYYNTYSMTERVMTRGLECIHAEKKVTP